MNVSTVSSAIIEIKQLRAEVKYMTGRLQMFDDMMLLFRSRPDIGQGRGLEEDICYLLQKEIEADIKPKVNPNAR